MHDAGMAAHVGRWGKTMEVYVIWQQMKTEYPLNTTLPPPQPPHSSPTPS